MTRKDYIKLADALRAARPTNYPANLAAAALTQWHYDVDTIANVLAADNPNFDRVRFDVACGRL